MHAALHLDRRLSDAPVSDADGLQQQGCERHPRVDVLELQVHQFLIDLHALDVQSVRDGAAQAGDLQLHAAQLARQVTHDELRAARGVERAPHQHQWTQDQRHDQDAGQYENSLAQGGFAHHSFGEKLMCNRGLLGVQLPKVAGGWHGSYSGCAMSTPRVSTGRRTRRPMPTE